MSLIEFIKYALIVSTSALGIFGTLYEFKDEGKANKKGIIAAVALSLLLGASIIMEILNNRESHRKSEIAAAQLKAENKQRKLLIEQSQDIEKRIKLTIQQLVEQKENLSENYSAIKAAEANLKELSKLQLSQQKSLDKDINTFKKVTAETLNRLSSPLDELYFSSEFKFLESEVEFPEYYKLLTPDFYDGNGLYMLAEKRIPTDFNIGSMYYFSPNDLKINVFRGVEPGSLSLEEFKNKRPELTYTSEAMSKKLSFFDIYTNLEEKSIIRTIDRKPLTLEYASGEITSSLDLTEFSKVGDYVTFRFTSIYPNNVAVSQLEIHTENSRDIGVKLKNCQALERHSGLTIHKDNSKNITYYHYFYACELWSADKLKTNNWLY
jgi:hypothetical protein